jgi:hypothetical protein
MPLYISRVVTGIILAQLLSNFSWMYNWPLFLKWEFYITFLKIIFSSFIEV